ncbi:MAG: DNA polymerase III subunit delta, partial [Chloroflexota bacterium]|nr:DNA polymerase III subunit delta [Chloroflexota bacterium]
MLYVIYGSDPLARREAFHKLKAALDKDGSLATNTVTFDARQATPQEVMAACDTAPFLGDCRLVVVEGLLQQGSRVKKGRKRAPSRTAKAEAADEADDGGPWAALAGYAPRMPATTTLVLLDDDVPSSNGLLMTIGPLGKVEHFVPPSERDLPGWVMQRAKKMGLKLDAPAARVLAELIGPDPLTLASELEKLLAYSGGSTVGQGPSPDAAIVRETDVRELVSRAKEHKGWDLADAVLDGQGAKAARVLHEMLEDGAVAAVLLSTVAGRYRRLAIIRDMLNRGEPSTVIARRINAKMGYGFDKLIDQAQRTSPAAIRAAYARLIQAELDLKRGITGGLMDDRLALELAVQELASRPMA